MSESEEGGRHRARHVLRMLLAQTGLELRLLTRRGESVLITLVVPALVLVFFSTVAPLPLTGGEARGEHEAPPVETLLPGVLALAVMSTGMVSVGIATAFERHYGVLKRLGGSPLPRPVLVAAKLISVVAMEMVQVALLTGIAVGLGWRGLGNLPLAGAGLLLGTCAFAGLGMWIGGSWRAEAALAGANVLYLVLFFLGGILVPLTRLPRGLGSVAALLPSAALADVLRLALLSASAPDPSLALPGILNSPIAVLCGWAILAPTLAALTFRWE